MEASQKEILDRQAQVHQELADVEPLVQQAKDAVQVVLFSSCRFDAMEYPYPVLYL